MTNEEMRELDAWIGVNLFNHGETVGLMKRGLWYRPKASGYTGSESEAGRYSREEAKRHEYNPPGCLDPVTVAEFSAPHYTTDAAPSLEVLKKCAEKVCVKVTQMVDGQWQVFSHSGQTISTTAPTLELAIAKFSKELFKKETNE